MWSSQKTSCHCWMQTSTQLTLVSSSTQTPCSLRTSATLVTPPFAAPLCHASAPHEVRRQTDTHTHTLIQNGLYLMVCFCLLWELCILLTFISQCLRDHPPTVGVFAQDREWYGWDLLNITCKGRCYWFPGIAPHCADTLRKWKPSQATATVSFLWCNVIAQCLAFYSCSWLRPGQLWCIMPS